MHLLSARSADITRNNETRLVDQIRSLCWSAPQEIRDEFTSGLWYTNPSEKYESPAGNYSQYMEK